MPFLSVLALDELKHAEAGGVIVDVTGHSNVCGAATTIGTFFLVFTIGMTVIEPGAWRYLIR